MSPGFLSKMTKGFRQKDLSKMVQGVTEGEKQFLVVRNTLKSSLPHSTRSGSFEK